MSATSRTIDGKPVMFRRFTKAEVVDACEKAYQAHRATLLDERDGGEDVKAALEAARKRRGDLQWLWQYIWTMAGALDVIATANPGLSVDALENWDVCKLAGEICGFDMSPVESGASADAAKDNGDGFVRPQQPQSGNT